MLVFLVCQIAFDVIALAGVWIVIRRLSEAQTRAEERNVASVQKVMSERIESWDKEVQQMKTVFTQQLETLRSICDKAADTLNRAQYKNDAFLPSEEEKEIKKMFEKQPDEIPTLRQLESTKERLKSEIGVDLRSVLRDQLA